MVYQIKAKIIKNQVANNYGHCVFDAHEIASIARPGQFIEVKVNNGGDPLLRRPLGVHKVRGEKVEVLYEIVGRGTQILSEKKPGEYLDVIGPLGNGFRFDPPVFPLSKGGIEGGSTPILVAGGMGVAPLVFLAEKLMESKIQNPKSKIIVLIGAKTKNGILCEKEFKKFGCEVKIATDDGSLGFHGRVTDLLNSILRVSSLEPRIPSIYACGPKPMLKELCGITAKYNVPAQVSLESHVACGIGACLGCVVKTNDGIRSTNDGFIYKRVCQEGPVFNAKEVIWE